MATRIRITQDDESDDDSPERKFIWEICSVATTVSRRLTSENTNKDSTKMRDSIFVIMKAAPKLSLDWAIMAFTEIVLRVPLAVIVEKFCPAILRRGMPPPSLARILARVCRHAHLYIR